MLSLVLCGGIALVFAAFLFCVWCCLFLFVSVVGFVFLTVLWYLFGFLRLFAGAVVMICLVGFLNVCCCFGLLIFLFCDVVCLGLLFGFVVWSVRLLSVCVCGCCGLCFLVAVFVFYVCFEFGIMFLRVVFCFSFCCCLFCVVCWVVCFGFC